MKKKQLATNSLIKIVAAYALFTGIVVAIFFFFFFANPQKTNPTPIEQPSATPSGTTHETPTEKEKFCGGIAGRQCPTGYSCKLDGNYPDAGGTCTLVACTMEAKQCLDGSSVGRTGPNCEFAPCPKGL